MGYVTKTNPQLTPNNRMPEASAIRQLTKPVFLIGSGAVIDAGVPDVYRLTAAAIARLPRPDRQQLSPLVSALRRAAPRRKLNIEHLVDALELGSGRAARPWLRHLVSPELALDPVEADRLVVTIRREVARALLEPPPVKALKYLQRLLLFKAPGVPLHIFTTNFDLCLETALRAAGVKPNVEMGGWDIVPPLRRYLEADGVCIYKLHGSVDWYDRAEFRPPRPRSSRGPNRWRRMFPGRQYHSAVTGVDVVPCPREDMVALMDRYHAIAPQLVLGTLEKVLPIEPYHFLLACFREALRNSRVLVVIGYGWSDTHLNRVILEGWLRSPFGQIGRAHV